MLTKRELTKIFLEQASLVATDESVKQWMKIIWVSPLSPIGYRLTSKGNTFLSSKVNLVSYTYNIKPGTVKSLKLFLQMNKFLSSPFYLTDQTITIYGESDAIMMGLMSGDIAQYLENFTRD